ncbi:hypothetical protein B0H66DRAFT_563887 [Apodospora peruviana]|uniref:tRNA(Ile)-lysidine synthetase n=1 Tax=Apodospora peruviana TaxID=516989 RepID=A0AAE0HYK4_9PEZI|nr:hypothetical protein B0H66DRAFT_563887 [Apodospora peruviana]
MSTTPQVLHRSARAISVHEFVDAVQAVCPPRFPWARSHYDQRVVLAISGGVDSMALAYLCQKARKYSSPFFRLSDNPVGSLAGVIIDHGLREGSSAEAQKVVETLQSKLNLKAGVRQIKWHKFGIHGSPKDLPNFETVARRLRYDLLGRVCLERKAVSLLTAHNEDDQYETVLMRLMAGQSFRGLQGIRAATDIPECYTKHGVWQSGFIDDQLRQDPIWRMRPNNHQRSMLRRHLRDEMDPEVLAEEMKKGLNSDCVDGFYDIATGSKRAPMPSPIPIEDGGIMIYRPLLQFSKERLIATCLQNGIPWVEDHTNHDPTFTQRNAVRYMYKNHELPAALQKPAILQLAERCRDKVATEEAETDRLLERTTICEFAPNVGTVVVELPEIALSKVPRRAARSPVHRQKRIEHYRVIAALLIRRLLSLVTPEQDVAPVKNLDYAVSLLFPSLATETPTLATRDQKMSIPMPRGPPKPYVICGVHFIPLTGEFGLRWLLARAPYVSNVPRPSVEVTRTAFRGRYRKHPKQWSWHPWSDWSLYDGRYWIRVKNRLPMGVRIAPFEMEHHKPFREGLVDRESKTMLALMLKRYAPGKIRSTLPAIYATANVSDVLAGGDYWSRYPGLTLSRASADDRAGGSSSSLEGQDTLLSSVEEGAADLTEGRPKREWIDVYLQEAAEEMAGKPQLLALPTLDIALPGADNFVQWEIRYRKVDFDIGRKSGRRSRSKGRQPAPKKTTTWDLRGRAPQRTGRLRGGHGQRLRSAALSFLTSRRIDMLRSAEASRNGRSARNVSQLSG